MEHNCTPACAKFGERFLGDTDDVFHHNAWDGVEMSEEKVAEALAAIRVQRDSPVPAAQAAQLLSEPKNKWEAFYTAHNNKFFKDRKWVEREFFPDILSAIAKSAADEGGKTMRVVEAGCGVGNTLFPLLELIRPHSNVHTYGFDFSQRAVDIVKEDAQYDPTRCTAFSWDLTKPPPAGCPLAEGSVDFIIAIYVLSALKPEDQQSALRNLSCLLRPGGRLFIKDYGRYDLTQLRLKSGRLLGENFYRRGDDTLVYFFEAEELRSLCQGAGLDEVQNKVDKRLIVNRRTKVTMFRRWLQCIYEKPLENGTEK